MVDHNCGEPLTIVARRLPHEGAGSEEPAGERPASQALSPAAQSLIRAVLSVAPDEAAEIRRATAGRRRPLRQTGPCSDFGADDGG